jgi:hypothetical protein
MLTRKAAFHRHSETANAPSRECDVICCVVLCCVVLWGDVSVVCRVVCCVVLCCVVMCCDVNNIYKCFILGNRRI